MAEVKVPIKTTYDNKGTKQARDDLGRFVKQGEKGGKGLKASFAGFDDILKGSIGQLAAGFGLTLGAKEVADLAIETFQLAEQAKVATSAFTNLSGSANIAKLNLQAMDRATRGLVSDTEQMQIANQLLGMNIVQTADQLEEVVGVSRRLGKEFRGLGAREAAEEFAIMIANMSVARLDSFGLSSGLVRDRINELSATTEGMTREQAFFQATMEEGQKTMERLGPEITTTADEISRLKAEFANLQVSIGGAAEKTGIIQSLFKSMADDLVIFRGLFDDAPETQIASLNIEIAQMEAQLENLAEREKTTGFFGILATVQIPKVEEALSGLREELEALNIVQAEATALAEQEQAARQAAIASEEKIAENIAKRAESARRLAEVQQEFGRDVVNLQDQTQDQLSDSRDQFDDDTEKAADDHTDRLKDIQKRAAKDRVKAARKLQKDLGKVDVALKRDLIRAQADEDKTVAKVRDHAAKDETRSRRSKQIDAVGDERLFQFDLRQLAADGNAIAIEQAIERRAIEQEIASEKAEFEKETEREKAKDTIATIRTEGSERKDQLQQQARDRSDDLRQRNREEIEERRLRVIEDEAIEDEAFTKRNAGLVEFFDERNLEIREGEQEGLREIAEALTLAEELTSTQLDKMVALAAEFGPKFGQAFADGMTKAISDNLEIATAIEAAEEIGAGAGPLPVAPGGGRNGLGPFQGGGSFTVGGSGGPDSQFVGFRASPGERVTVTPAGQAGAGGMTIIINNNAPILGVDELEARFESWGQQIINATAGALT